MSSSSGFDCTAIVAGIVFFVLAANGQLGAHPVLLALSVVAVPSMVWAAAAMLGAMWKAIAAPFRRTKAERKERRDAYAAEQAVLPWYAKEIGGRYSAFIGTPAAIVAMGVTALVLGA